MNWRSVYAKCYNPKQQQKNCVDVKDTRTVRFHTLCGCGTMEHAKKIIFNIEKKTERTTTTTTLIFARRDQNVVSPMPHTHTHTHIATHTITPNPVY